MHPLALLRVQARGRGAGAGRGAGRGSAPCGSVPALLGDRPPATSRKPTSTRLLLMIARTPVAFLPRGGIPVVDASVLAEAHVRALERGEPGRRYVVAGPYLSSHALAELVARVTGQPKHVVTVPDCFERPLAFVAGGYRPDESRRTISRVLGPRRSPGWIPSASHVAGARADAAFGLRHPHPLTSIRAALTDAQRSGVARWLKIRATTDERVAPSGEAPRFPPQRPDFPLRPFCRELRSLGGTSSKLTSRTEVSVAVTVTSPHTIGKHVNLTEKAQ